MLTINFLALAPLATLGHAAVLQTRVDDTTIGLTPAMGWSSWNVAQCDAASEAYAMSTANKFIELGLKDLGYEYINIDDCWTTKQRDGNGNLVPDPSKWPRGIRPVVDDLHALGLKFGLYGCAGTLTCASYPGSEGHEYQDAQLLASWDVDFWKHDNCFTPCNVNPTPQTCWSSSINTEPWYARMADAIESVKGQKEIMFNLCQWGRNQVWTWGDKYGHSWRIENDNWGDWASVVRIGSRAGQIPQYSGPGGFNDLDMLFVGNNKLTHNQERLHFGLWAIAKSPLIIGADLTKISTSSLDIIRNKALITINQDPLGIPAAPFRPANSPEPGSGKIYPYWAGPLSNGIVVAFAGASGAGNFSTNFSEVPGLNGGEYCWTEAYSGQRGRGTSLSVTVAQDDIAVFTVTRCA